MKIEFNQYNTDLVNVRRIHDPYPYPCYFCKKQWVHINVYVEERKNLLEQTISLRYYYFCSDICLNSFILTHI